MEKSFILSLIFAAIVAVFALKNGDKVLIDFIFTKVEVSQAIVIFLSAILGAVVVAILNGVKNVKHKKEIRDLNKKIQSIKEENNNMKALLEDRGEEITKLKKSIKELEQKIEEFNNSIEENDIEIES
ncbi:putative integral membrane protein [Keratinibaculum paraultunense]|uniref:Putative integral membrane protein n=1 Tax=Keratinibaculum paraultunense TaxID=1278232 RepID=A0A4R3KYD3_9FIRM|nr:LapA family protein [Keratinibaculum paraultunense]QQY78758.1 DUF1049 domain-containing protein [Keratinibaculum paraultunense]TCS89562.1 putative integral membrane protein [Keratinibaculum paraultunense]